MQVRRLAVALLATVLFTGCTQGGGTAPSPTPPEPRLPARGETTNGGPSGLIATELPVTPVPDGLRRVTYTSAMEIPGPGSYVVNLKTGKVESWQSAEGDDVRLSDDGRWAIARRPDYQVWANRQSGKVYRWNTQDLMLVATSAKQLVLAKAGEVAGPRVFYVTDHEFQVQHAFSLEMELNWGIQAQFAPDGRTVALGSVSGATTGARAVVVDLATGQSRELAAPSAPAAGQVVGAELLDPASDQLVVNYVVSVMDPIGLSQEVSIVRLYTWQGKLVREISLTGRAQRLSPDGRLLVTNQNPDRLVEATVVTDLATGQHLFRVLNASGGAWTADSTSLLLSSRAEGYYLITAEGDLEPAPSVPPSDQFLFMAGLTPSPDDPRRFTAGLAVVNDGGQVVQRVELPKDKPWLIWSPHWGATGEELTFHITPQMGKDGDYGYEFPLPIHVQRPPFPDPYLLQVQDPQGECLNLRESFSRTSRVIRCLPTGTQLAVADLFQAPMKMNEALYHDDGQFWLWARTEQGETGWVSLSAGSVTWAP